MAKRSTSEIKFISINPFNNSSESLISVAILNALILLQADKNKLVKVPSRKELTKLLKNVQFDNFCKAFDEINHVRIRKVPCLEAVGVVGIVIIAHPIIGAVPCLAYRDQTITDMQYKLVNSGLGEDEVTIHVIEHYNEKLEIKGSECYQIFLDTGSKEEVEHKEFSCNDCSHYAIEGKEEICLYDKEILTSTTKCCNKYLDCFKWNSIKEEL